MIDVRRLTSHDKHLSSLSSSISNLLISTHNLQGGEYGVSHPLPLLAVTLPNAHIGLTVNLSLMNSARFMILATK